MSFSRYFTFFAVLPFSVLVLVQGCGGGSTSGGACPVVVDDSGPADQARCGAGPKQGTACCLSSTGTCAGLPLPLCQSICCASDGGHTTVIDVEGGSSTTEGGVFEASTVDAHRDSSTASSCPGNTKQKAPFVNTTCQAALEQSCCSELKSCFNIVTAGGSTDCNAYSSCIAGCASQADPTTCQNDCDTLTTPSVKTAYEAIVTCATNDPTTSAACQ